MLYIVWKCEKCNKWQQSYSLKNARDVRVNCKYCNATPKLWIKGKYGLEQNTPIAYMGIDRKEASKRLKGKQLENIKKRNEVNIFRKKYL